jgi:hypothetical protein
MALSQGNQQALGFMESNVQKKKLLNENDGKASGKMLVDSCPPFGGLFIA